MRKQDISDDILDLGILAASGALSGYYVHNTGFNNINPFGKKRVAVIGGIKEWDPVVRANAAKLIRDEASGIPVDRNALEAAKRVFRMDSFSGQTLAAADALHNSGIDVKVLRRALNSPMKDVDDLPDARIKERPHITGKVFDKKDFYRPIDLKLNDIKGSDAVLQVGDVYNDLALHTARKKGTGIYRLLSDYGDGNFKQPDNWLGGQNWMKVRDPKTYDRLFVPGGDEKDLWKELGIGRKSNVNIGDIAISPIFKDMKFSRHAGDAPKAMLTLGGGSGSSLVMRNRGVPEAQRYNFIGKDKNLFDEILDALRAQKNGHNAKLDVYLGSTISDPVNMFTPDGKIVRGRVPSDVKLSKEMRKLVDLLNPDSRRYKLYSRSVKGRNLLKSLSERYKGLNLIGSVPQDQIGKAYASSDYIFALPGSTTAEFSAIKGKRHGGLIHLIPSEEQWAPRHFRGNAEYVNRIMQPGAKSNIVSITGKNRAKAILDAVNEGGFKDWGRRAISGKDPLAPMVKAIKRDILAKRLGRSGKLGLLALPGIIAGGNFIARHRNKEDGTSGKSLLNRILSKDK